MWEWLVNLQADEQIKLMALIGAAIAFVSGLVQYRKAQQWKRAEWVAQEMAGLGRAGERTVRVAERTG